MRSRRPSTKRARGRLRRKGSKLACLSKSGGGGGGAPRGRVSIVPPLVGARDSSGGAPPSFPTERSASLYVAVRAVAVAVADPAAVSEEVQADGNSDHRRLATQSRIGGSVAP